VSDIGWAIRALKNGERVKRREWGVLADAYDAAGGTAWGHLYIETRPGHAPALMVRHGDGGASHFGMIDDHLLAGDWELA